MNYLKLIDFILYKKVDNLILSLSSQYIVLKIRKLFLNFRPSLTSEFLTAHLFKEKELFFVGKP